MRLFFRTPRVRTTIAAPAAPSVPVQAPEYARPQLSEWERETLYAAFLEGIDPAALPVGSDVRQRMNMEWEFLSLLDGATALDHCISFFESGEGL